LRELTGKENRDGFILFGFSVERRDLIPMRYIRASHEMELPEGPNMKPPGGSRYPFGAFVLPFHQTQRNIFFKRRKK